MTSYKYHQAPFAPPERADMTHPVLPTRSEFQDNHQEKHLIPQIPDRADRPTQNNSTLSRQVIKEQDCSCNYNRYATKKTIGHGLLEFALITSNAMQLRTLIAQKQRDGIWIASLVLVCFSVVAQVVLAYILVVLGKGDIRNPQKQDKLEKKNNIALFITMLISMINVIINIFMSTTNAQNYLDTASIELLRNNT